jgi:hypothetical protein
MIRRDAGAHFLLVNQHDHALAAGRLARGLGRPPFTPPSSLDTVTDAIAQHDCGWPLHDDQPTLNRDGLPLHVFEAPVPLAVRVWSASVEGAMARGDYQGLLVSLHVMGLSAMFLSNATNPSRPDVFEVNKFQHRQSEIQDTLRKRLGLRTDVPLRLGLAQRGASPEDDQLLFNFRLLTAMDRLSLALCCGKHLFPAIDDVHPIPGVAPVAIRATMPQPDTLELAPWPFDEPQISFEVPARRLPKAPFPDVEAFRDAYHRAPSEPLNLYIRPRGSGGS